MKQAGTPLFFAVLASIVFEELVSVEERIFGTFQLQDHLEDQVLVVWNWKK